MTCYLNGEKYNNCYIIIHSIKLKTKLLNHVIKKLKGSVTLIYRSKTHKKLIELINQLTNNIKLQKQKRNIL